MTLLDNEDDNLPDIDENKDYFQELVGDGKKFKTPQDLAKGKYEADEYIKMIVKQKDTLANDYLRLKADYDARAKLEEVLKTFQNANANDNLDNTPEEKNVNQPQFDPNKLEEMIESRLSAREKQRIADANLKTVKDELREKLGRNWSEKLRATLDDLDLSEGDMELLARRSPKAFLKTVGLVEQTKEPTFQAPPMSSVRNDNFKPKGSEKRTWSYYQALKEKNPRAWLDPKVQTQMYHDAQELGSAFADGDFVKQNYEERL
jgi:hypothetical protein